MNDQLNDLLRRLHIARTDAVHLKDTMNDIVERAKQSKEYRNAASARELIDAEVELLEERVREQGLAAYLETRTKTINDFVKIREESVFTITDASAMRTFVEKRLPDALIVDEKKVKNYAIKIGPVDGTTVTIQPKVTIATDLSGVVYE